MHGHDLAHTDAFLLNSLAKQLKAPGVSLPDVPVVVQRSGLPTLTYGPYAKSKKTKP